MLEPAKTSGWVENRPNTNRFKGLKQLLGNNR
ncbi:MAG: hypothetical protein ACI9EW_002196, partial [Cellvibrionaceae bacterium]